LAPGAAACRRTGSAGLLPRLRPGSDADHRPGAPLRPALADRRMLRPGQGRGRPGSIRSAYLDGVAPLRDPLPSGTCVSGGDAPRRTRGRRRAKGGSAAKLIPLTVPEVRRLVQAMAEREEHRVFRFGWSVWRRARIVERSRPRVRASPPVPRLPGLTDA